MLVILAPRDHLYGMARIFSLIEEHRHPNVHVVRSIREAYALLGVNAPEFSPIAVP